MTSKVIDNRVNFGSVKNPMPLPDFLDVQLKSFKDFLQLDTPPEERKNDGLYKVFAENFPITDTRNNFVLEFLDYYIDPPRYTIDECLERGLTYSVPLKAKLKLYCTDPDHEDFGTVIQDVFLGPIPYMTANGTFVINGAERVVVSQLHRSPGVFFGQSVHANGSLLYSARIIPFKGSWIEFATDINNVMYAYIDRKKKLPVTTLLRAIGFETDKDILQIFDLAEEVKVNKKALKEVIGCKLAARVLKSWNEDFVDEDTGEVVSIERNEVIMDRETEITEDNLMDILESGAATILVHKDEAVAQDFSIIFNTLAKDPSNSEKEAVLYIYRQLRNADPADDASAREVIQNLFFSDKRYDLGDVGRYRINKKLGLDTEMDVRVLTKEDIIEIIKYLIQLINSKATVDDIDHLSNRRVRTVGEQLSNQFSIGLARMSRTIRERMNVRDNEVFTPTDLINAKTISSVINSFFGTNPLSQFMDQTNPLAELTNKRRISALGPGGLTRDRASMEVRDVHYTHYGRICPIETPEGQNIGLINNLSTYARINNYGFIETPYRIVINDKDAKGVEHFYVSDRAEYLSADKERGRYVAGANIRLGEPVMVNGEMVREILDDEVTARHDEDNILAPKHLIEYVDVSPKQIVSIAAACIPFLENDDSTRALMGANMQRQALPLLRPSIPYVGTGMEGVIAKDSGLAVVAVADGKVTYMDSSTIVIKEGKESRTYKLQKFDRSNNGTCINQKPIVKVGDDVKAGSVIADGPAMRNGELALGQNILVAYMTWNGYNYEDAIVMSERMVKEDTFTTIHIERYELECRDTKLGAEEITRDVPNVSDEAKTFLDERGIIVEGAEVKEGDILVGKVTPKGQTEPTPEEKLLMAIFAEKTKEGKDTSLRVPHGGAGIIHKVRVFSRKNKDPLPPGVNEIVRVYIVQKRKISEGDKMSGRHGNKGVISRILPVQDMPFLADGTPIDIMLSPMGVPSRMNIGQILEVHLGLACSKLKMRVATPPFDGVSNDEIVDLMKKAGISDDGKTVLYDGRTGERFNERISVGIQYMIKLVHMVDDKIHARATGPYSLVTQQPLGGKAQNGGQRFGEMEVWALEGYGAAHVLQEMLTIKSDDRVGRRKTYEAIIKGYEIPRPGMPEAFKVFTKELRGLGMRVNLYNKEGETIDMDALAKEALVEERKVNSAIRNLTNPKDEEPSPVDTVEVSSEQVAEEGLSVSSRMPGDAE